VMPQNQAMGRPAFPGKTRPRPRLEGRPNPALRGKESPYGDGARVVPKKLGMRAEAAKRMKGMRNA
jgi:hypothetical protein